MKCRCWSAALAGVLSLGVAGGASARPILRPRAHRRVLVRRWAGRRVIVRRRRWVPVRTVWRRPVRRVIIVQRRPRPYIWAPAYRPARRVYVVRSYPRPVAYRPAHRVYVVRSYPRPLAYRPAPVYVSRPAPKHWHDEGDDRHGHVPPGWSHGRKTGWGGAGMPPGQAKKMR